MYFSAITTAWRAAAFDSVPGRLRRVASYAGLAGRACEPFTDVLAALDGKPEWWARAPVAGCRASAVAEKACRLAYRAGQVERARAAIAAKLAHDPGSPVVGLIEIAARATHAADGDESSLISAADIVALVTSFVEADDDVVDVAEEALRTYHFQIVVNDDVAIALRRAEDLAQSLIVDADSISDLASAILAAEPLLDLADAETCAERAVSGLAAAGNLHAAGLVAAERDRTRREFAALADRMESRGPLHPDLMGLANQSREQLPYRGTPAEREAFFADLIAAAAERVTAMEF